MEGKEEYVLVVALLEKASIRRVGNAERHVERLAVRSGLLLNMMTQGDVFSSIRGVVEALSNFLKCLAAAE